ncbi:MAG TPA: hypothetical protein DCY07_01115 [Rhodospirillaceae bacterium]|nr:hypothetical protein [Rhodospirillaceae bacterium]
MPSCPCLRLSALYFFATFLLSSSPAFAAPASPEIDDRFCEALVKHTPDADVAYQAGVDVDGNAVVPADLDGTNNFALPDEITIPLTADLMIFLKMDASALPASAMQRNDIPLGTLTLRGDQVLFNDQSLTNTQQDNLAVLCLKPTK